MELVPDVGYAFQKVDRNMPDETNNDGIDESLFPTAESFGEFETVFKEGQEELKNPIGVFQGRIVSATFGRSASSNRPQITYKLEILVGKYKDREVMKYDGLGTPQQAKIALQSLNRLGVDAAKLTPKTLPAVLLTLAGIYLTFEAKQNGDFYNVYFQKKLDKETMDLALANDLSGSNGTGVATTAGSPRF